MKLRQQIRNKFSTLLFLAICIFTLPLIAAAQGKIAFASFRDGNSEIYVMNPDGSGQTRLTNTLGLDGQPSLSASGSKIAFTSNRDGPASNFEIYVMNANGSNQTRLTNNSSFDTSPSFSADGSKIVFVSTRNGSPKIYVMNADGTGQTQLTNVPATSDFQPSFSPDGSKIIFVSDTPSLGQDIYVMNANGTDSTRLTDNSVNNFSPSFSPDGGKIIFGSVRVGNFDIYVMNADGTAEVRLTSGADVEENGSFNPDGSKIVFESNRGGPTEIYVMNADGSSPTKITNNPESRNTTPSWGGDAPPNTTPTITAAGGVASERDAGASNSQIAAVNDVEDAENSLGVTVNGGASATSNGVTVLGIAVNSSGNVTANISSTCGATNASFTLRVTDSGSLSAQTTLNVAVTNETVDPTLTLPPDIVMSLPLNSTDTSKIVNFTVSATDNCDANPAVTAVPASGSAFPVGTTTVQVTATDVSGNTAMGSFTVAVSYNFAGFFQPIYNLPAVNTVNGGQSIPVKFSLSGNKRLNIFATGFPASRQIDCTTGAPIGTAETTVTAGSSGLRYDADTDTYIYVWKTEKRWEEGCRQLTVKLNDGSFHVANFQFR